MWGLIVLALLVIGGVVGAATALSGGGDGGAEGCQVVEDFSIGGSRTGSTCSPRWAPRATAPNKRPPSRTSTRAARATGQGDRTQLRRPRTRSQHHRTVRRAGSGRPGRPGRPGCSQGDSGRLGLGRVSVRPVVPAAGGRPAGGCPSLPRPPPCRQSRRDPGRSGQSPADTGYRRPPTALPSSTASFWDHP